MRLEEMVTAMYSKAANYLDALDDGWRDYLSAIYLFDRCYELANDEFVCEGMRDTASQDYMKALAEDAKYIAGVTIDRDW